MKHYYFHGTFNLKNYNTNKTIKIIPITCTKKLIRKNICFVCVLENKITKFRRTAALKLKFVSRLFLHLVLVARNHHVVITYSIIYSRDKIVDIDIDSKVRQIPDFVKMSSVTKQVAAGRYKQGDVSVKTLITQTSAVVRPKSPFSTTSSLFGKLVV